VIDDFLDLPLIFEEWRGMPEQATFKETIRSYFGRKMVTDKRTGKRFEATQARLAEELVMTPETLSRKLKDPSRFTPVYPLLAIHRYCIPIGGEVRCLMPLAEL
jgi:hypothetical protein